MNIIAENKYTSLIVQVSEMDKFIIKGQVLVGDKYNKVGYVSTWATNLFNISNEPKEDKIVTDVIAKFKKRSELGIKKYGTTLEENNTDDFITHLEEELMDALLYLQKLKKYVDSKNFRTTQ